MVSSNFTILNMKKKIIFICHGNICRSVAAEFIMKSMSNDYDICSRATSFEEIGNDIYPPMKRELLNNNIPFERHYAQRINYNDYQEADYIFYMDDENYAFLYRMFGDDEKIKPVYEWTPSIKEIEDPWYTGRFNVVVSQLKQCIKDILDNIN